MQSCPVAIAMDGERIERARIYIAPAHYQMRIASGTVGCQAINH